MISTSPMATPHPAEPRSIARSCGECIGHILKAIKTPVKPADCAPAVDPIRPPPHQENVQTVRAAVREEQVGTVLHRRIVIDQVVQLHSPEMPKGTTL